jgi:beta-glucosidase
MARLVPLLALVISTTMDAQQPTRPAAQPDRVEALLSRMTLAEKIGQMTQVNLSVVSADTQPARDSMRLDPAKLRNAVVARGVGSILNTGEGALPAATWQKLLREIQDVATRETRLRIPIVYGIDAVHGHNYLKEGTLFPHNVALAATFNRELVHDAGEITASEVLATGVRWNFAPVLDVVRHQAWPRFYETFGEDPWLATQLGVEAVKGMQSDSVAVTLKHYLGYGLSRSGRDRTPAEVSRRYVREIALPPFRAAIKAGARSVMVNSGEIDGEPVHASRYWLTDVLRGELGFTGVAVTDWQDIDFLHTRHRVASSHKEAVRLAIDAGIDMSMNPLDFRFTDDLMALVKEGAISEKRIDESVRRILRLKESLGLFDSPYPDPTKQSEVGAALSKTVARQAAREAIVLLKNEASALPLAKTRRVLVTGPAADSRSALLGGWSYTWQGSDTTWIPKSIPTLVDALRARVPQLRYVRGSDFTAPADIAAAVQAARESDVAIVTLGETGYAEWVGDIRDLRLPAPQVELAKAVIRTGTPTILVLLEGRPRIISDLADSARAIVLAMWPGMEGADAIAEVLTGEWNPSGRLPFTYPRDANALGTYDYKFTEGLGAWYDRKPGAGFEPQFQFGHGLSYTTFSYSEIALDRSSISTNDSIKATVRVTNTGGRAGDESVLLFTRHHYSSLTPSVRRLRGFEKVRLGPGESRDVVFVIPPADLSIVTHDGRPVVEPGDVDLMIGDRTTTVTLKAPPSRPGR